MEYVLPKIIDSNLEDTVFTLKVADMDKSWMQFDQASNTFKFDLKNIPEEILTKDIKITLEDPRGAKSEITQTIEIVRPKNQTSQALPTFNFIPITETQADVVVSNYSGIFV